MSENLLKLPSAVSLCQMTRRKIMQNCCVSILIKLIAIGFAISGYLMLWEAVLVDIGALLFVVGNGSSILFLDNCFVEGSHAKQNSTNGKKYGQYLPPSEANTALQNIEISIDI